MKYTFELIKNIFPNLSLSMGGLVWVDSESLEELHEEYLSDSLFGEEYSNKDEHDQVMDCIEGAMDRVLDEIGVERYNVPTMMKRICFIIDHTLKEQGEQMP